MERDPTSDIIERYLADSCSTEERRLIESAFLAYLKDSSALSPDTVQMSRITAEMQDEIKHFLTKDSTIIVKRLPKKFSLTIRRAATAALLLLGLSFGYYFLVVNSVLDPVRQEMLTTDLLPGTNKASLILADGSIIDLNSEQEGIVMNKAAVTYTDGSTLIGQHQNPEGWNIMRTPKGGQYKLTLADGTKVWLNAASALRYPTAFNGIQREVELLEGEGYFEITPDKTKPFKVISKGQYIEVIGTSFNISAYEDEISVRTTLIEGTIKVVTAPTSGSAATGDELLKPGEETILANGSLSKQKADIAAAIGWKEGLFVFNNTDLKTILRQIARWYDFDINLNDVPDKTFSAEIPRNVKLSTLLKVIESNSNLTFHMERTSPKEERRLRLNE